MKNVIVIALVAAWLAAPAARADHEEPAADTAPRHLTSAGVLVAANNLYGAVFATYRYRHTFNEDPQPGLFSNLYRELGFTAATNAYVTRFGVHYELQPIAIFRFRVGYSGSIIAGIPSSLGAGLPFDTRNDDFSDDVLQARKGENVSAYNHQVVLEPTLQGRAGPIILVNTFTLTINYMSASGNYMYDNQTDSLLRIGEFDRLIQNQTLLMWDTFTAPGVHKLYVGATYQFNRAGIADVRRHRLGGVVVYSPSYWKKTLYEPTFVVMGGVNLVDRHRENEPYALLVFRTGIRKH